MPKKRIILIIVSSVLLLTIIAVGMIAMLNKNSTAQGSHPTSTPILTNGSLLSGQQNQTPSTKYPDPTKQDGLPDSVKVVCQSESVLLRASVTEGYQIYECQASTTDPSGFAWKLQAPFAILKADDGTNVVHSTDPTWLYTGDESEVKANVGQFT